MRQRSAAACGETFQAVRCILMCTHALFPRMCITPCKGYSSPSVLLLLASTHHYHSHRLYCLPGPASCSVPLNFGDATESGHIRYSRPSSFMLANFPITACSQRLPVVLCCPISVTLRSQATVRNGRPSSLCWPISSLLRVHHACSSLNGDNCPIEIPFCSRSTTA